MKFSICTIASFGATIRKYATAFTRTGTLSLVITSCGGMFSVIVRRSTRTIGSTTGIRMKRPGPFGSGSSRPRRKTIARSYSRITLIALMTNSSTRNTTTTRITSAVVTISSLLRRDREREAVHGIDPNMLSGIERCSRARAPQLATDEDEAALADDALHADDLLRPDRDRRSPHGDRLSHGDRPEAAEQHGDGDDQPDVRVVRGARVVEQRREADRERNEAAERQRP